MGILLLLAQEREALPRLSGIDASPPGPAWYTWSLFVSGASAWGSSGGFLFVCVGGGLNVMFYVGFSNVYCFCFPRRLFSRAFPSRFFPFL